MAARRVLVVDDDVEFLEEMTELLIVITGAYSDKDRKYLTNTLGACACVTKPFLPQDLINTLEAAIAPEEKSQ